MRHHDTITLKITVDCKCTCSVKKKNQIVESRSTQVRTIHECDTQLLYGASGPTVSEDGSCRASDTCALQGYTVQWRQTHNRHNRDTDKELRTDKQTWDPTLFQQSSCHCRMTTVMRSHHTSAAR